MPGLHTDYWQRTCPCMVCLKPPERYCRKCDEDTIISTRVEYDAVVKECSICGHAHETSDREPVDTAMERWEEFRELRD